MRGSAGQANAIATRRSDSEQAIVASVIVAFVILVVGVLGIQVNGSLRTGRGVEAVSATLAEVHQRQQSFRLLNQRFATSQELASMGMLWPSTQTVVRENVTPSHWFMSVRDRDTGVICQKTGELFDESPLEHRATCRSAGS